MFFIPKSPIGIEARKWIHYNYEWFIGSFGEDYFKSVKLVLPTPEFFPFRFDGTLESAQLTINTLCSRFNIDKNKIYLEGYKEDIENTENALRDVLPNSEGNHSGAAGYYSQAAKGLYKIAIKKSNLNNPISIIATIAHELCHVLLLGENRISAEDKDMEPLTDLLTVFLGLGIFTANTAVQFNQWQDGQKQGWSIQRQGYLTQEAFGYALAAWSQLKNDLPPIWQKYLSTDIKAYCKQSLGLLKYETKKMINPFRTEEQKIAEA